MTRGIRAAIGGVALTLLLGALSGCSLPPPPDAWRILPLSYDNRMDGELLPRPTDVTFPMRLTPDTAGGFWGYSAGSWLHVDAAGDTVRRFNLLDGEVPMEIRGVAALGPDLLVVSAPAVGASGALHLFDTVAGTWEVLHRVEGILGDVATHDGDVYVVAFATGDGVFTVQRFDPDIPGVLVEVTPPLPWPPALSSSLHGTVAIDVGPDGSIHVATEAERIVVDADGAIRERASHEVPRPDVAVGPDGVAVWTTSAPETEPAPVHIVGGSSEARAVLEARGGCAQQHVLVGRGTGDTALVIPCVQGLAWVGPDAFVASAGGEGGAVLAGVDPPTG